MPPVKMRGDGRKARDPKKTIARMLSYMGKYKLTMALVVLCILFNAVAMAVSNASLGVLVDDFIKPMLAQQKVGS